MGTTPFLIPYLFPLITVWGAYLGPWGFYAAPVAAFILVPLLDLVFSKDPYNPDAAQQKALGNAIGYKLVVWGFVPVQIALLIWGAHIYGQPTLGLWDKLGLILSIGIITGGIGITFAHELGHRTNSFERSLSRILLMTVCYGHWHVEHVIGHHAHVATPRDPATAKFGQSFYAFFLQTVFGTFKSAWEIEYTRAQRRGVSRPLFNRMFFILVGQLVIAGLFVVAFGPEVLVYFFGQSFIAFTLLELINYIEHYGLTRKRGADGRYEKVTAAHSWNCCTRVSNWLLINLQRHSHHHMRPALRYPQLYHMEGSPQLPTGYPGMVIVALLPPLFKALVHPRMQR